MTAHTPGPWKATEKTVTAPETEDRLGMECRLYGGNSQDNRANARLIGAAPDLLDVARALVAYDKADHEDSVAMMLDYADMLKAARAAIKKATEGTK